MEADIDVCLEIDWKKDKTKSDPMKGNDFKYSTPIKVAYVGDNLTLKLLSSENLLIGTTRMKFTQLCKGTGVDDWWDLMHNDKPVGELHISSQWEPRGGHDSPTKI